MEAFMSTREEIEKRRAERKAAHDEARAKQELVDLEAIDALEAASGEPLHTGTVNGYKPGAVVKFAFRSPTPAEYKRYTDMVGRAHKKEDATAQLNAQKMLAESCLVYPTDELRAATLEAFPGLLVALSTAAAAVAEAAADETGKG